MADPRYPIGKFEPPTEVGEADRETFIRQIEETPARLREAVGGLTLRSWRPHTGRAAGPSGRWSITFPTVTSTATSASASP